MLTVNETGLSPRAVVPQCHRRAEYLAHLERVEASLELPWWPNIVHSLFSDHLKMTIATFRVGTWYFARRTEGGGTLRLQPAPLHAERSLSWRAFSFVMPHIGLGWMAPSRASCGDDDTSLKRDHNHVFGWF